MSVIVSGGNKYNQITSETSFSINKSTNINIDFDDIISYSVYREFAVVVHSIGLPCAVGNNSGYQIHKDLPEIIKDWTSFSITDEQNNECFVESVVCGSNYTLYKVKKSEEDEESRLAFVMRGKMQGDPVFLNTGNWIPIELYGGSNICAAIDEKGAIHVIGAGIFSKENYDTTVLYLPNNDLPISVAFCGNFIFCLSGRKIVYEFCLSDVNQGKSQFTRTTELKGIFVNCISGTLNHCIAVSTSGEVFVRGSNNDSQLGFENGQNEVTNFTKLQFPRCQKIEAAFAGGFHSIFVTNEGKVFTCGCNKFKELLLDTKIPEITKPTDSRINSNVHFCIAGYHLSVVFVDHLPPRNSPNQTLQLKSPYPYPCMLKSDEIEQNMNANDEIIDLKKEINEKNEVNDLLQEMVNVQIEELGKLNEENERLKQILQMHNIDFENDDDNNNNQNNSNTQNNKTSLSLNNDINNNDNNNNLDNTSFINVETNPSPINDNYNDNDNNQDIYVNDKNEENSHANDDNTNSQTHLHDNDNSLNIDNNEINYSKPNQNDRKNSNSSFDYDYDDDDEDDNKNYDYVKNKIINSSDGNKSNYNINEPNDDDNKDDDDDDKDKDNEEEDNNDNNDDDNDDNDSDYDDNIPDF